MSSGPHSRFKGIRGIIAPMASAWAVFVLFLIPIGGGIPAGVLLGAKRHVGWPEMLVLYFLSDVVLACVFEPLMRLAIAGGKRSRFFARFNEALRKSTAKTISGFGSRLRPHTLVLIAFGVDPMTGRAATVMAGHGVFSGWSLAILGDMFYFTLIMVSTLWLHSILGDGTVATIVILVVMMGVPYLMQMRRKKRVAPSGTPG